MKQLTCEMCGSTDLLKQDGVFVCQTCGMKYSIEEAKKMMIEGTVDVQGTVKVDNSAFVQKYLANARRAKQKEDWLETEKYYNMVEQNDPTNIEAIFYSTFARVKTALLEAETSDKRQAVFNVLVRSVSIIDDNYNPNNEEHDKLLFEIMDDINALKDGHIVPTTHLQSYVTRNGYGNIVDRNQVVEEDSLKVTYFMIDQVIDAYAESIRNIVKVQCKDLSKQEIYERALKTLQGEYYIFTLGYFFEYAKKYSNSPVGYAGIALMYCATDKSLTEAIDYLGKAKKYTPLDSEEKAALDYIINYKFGEYHLTLLMVTAFQYHFGGLKYLVDNGADIHAVSNQNVTALWYACYKNPGEANVNGARNIAKYLLDRGARVDVKSVGGIDLYNKDTDPIIAQMIKAKNPNIEQGAAAKKGCYVATSVYGSYDCPQVWTLRRFRDDTLGSTWYGRLFIRTYYAISPTLVKWFGKTKWFNKLWKRKLDRMVSKLQNKGVADTPYEDKDW